MAQLLQTCFSAVNRCLVTAVCQSGIYGPFTKNSISRSMATLTQIHARGRPEQKRPKKIGIMGVEPYMKGVVLRTLVKKPKKPNSANRKCVRVKLTNGNESTAYIPGEGNNLQEHSIVLTRGGRVQDLPGVKLKCVRGKYDLSHVKK